MNALGAAALVEALAGRTERAAALAQLAADRADGTLSVDHPGSLFWRTALAVIARLRDDLDEADDRAGEALELAIQWRRWPFVALLLGEQGMIDLARGEPTAALARLRDRALFPMPPAGPMVEGRLRSIEASGPAWPSATTSCPPSIPAWPVAVGSWPRQPFQRSSRRAGSIAPASTSRSGRQVPLRSARSSTSSARRSSSSQRATLRRRAHGLQHCCTGRTATAVIRPYLDVGEPVIALLETVAREHPSRHVDEVLGQGAPGADTPDGLRRPPEQP